MRRNIAVLVLFLLIGLGVAECVREGTSVQPAATVAWWTLLYEQPNPEHLPVKVKFSLLNGVEVCQERR